MVLAQVKALQRRKDIAEAEDQILPPTKIGIRMTQAFLGFLHSRSNASWNTPLHFPSLTALNLTREGNALKLSES